MKYVCVFICFLLWLIFTLLLSFTVIGLVISVSDEWQEMGDKILIRKADGYAVRFAFD